MRIGDNIIRRIYEGAGIAAIAFCVLTAIASLGYVAFIIFCSVLALAIVTLIIIAIVKFLRRHWQTILSQKKCLYLLAGTLILMAIGLADYFTAIPTDTLLFARLIYLGGYCIASTLLMLLINCFLRGSIKCKIWVNTIILASLTILYPSLVMWDEVTRVPDFSKAEAYVDHSPNGEYSMYVVYSNNNSGDRYYVLSPLRDYSPLIITTEFIIAGNWRWDHHHPAWLHNEDGEFIGYTEDYYDTNPIPWITIPPTLWDKLRTWFILQRHPKLRKLPFESVKVQERGGFELLIK